MRAHTCTLTLPCDSSYWTNGHQRFVAAAAQFGYAPEELWKSNLLVNARPGDIAEAILYAVSAPPHVNVSTIELQPVEQTFGGVQFDHIDWEKNQ